MNAVPAFGLAGVDTANRASGPVAMLKLLLVAE